MLVLLLNAEILAQVTKLKLDRVCLLVRSPMSSQAVAVKLYGMEANVRAGELVLVCHVT